MRTHAPIAALLDATSVHLCTARLPCGVLTRPASSNLTHAMACLTRMMKKSCVGRFFAENFAAARSAT